MPLNSSVPAFYYSIFFFLINRTKIFLFDSSFVIILLSFIYVNLNIFAEICQCVSSLISLIAGYLSLKNTRDCSCEIISLRACLHTGKCVNRIYGIKLRHNGVRIVNRLRYFPIQDATVQQRRNRFVLRYLNCFWTIRLNLCPFYDSTDRWCCSWKRTHKKSQFKAHCEFRKYCISCNRYNWPYLL